MMPKQSIADSIRWPAYREYTDSGVDWLERIPSHWLLVRNAALFTERSDKNFPDLPALSVSLRHGVTLQEYSDDQIERGAEDKSGYKRALTGELVYNKMRMWQGAVGVAPVDGIVSPAYIVCSPLQEVSPRYYEYFYRTPLGMMLSGRYSYGICKDMNSLRFEDFKCIQSIYPPIDEQKAIVSFLDRETARIDLLISQKKQLIDLLRERRQNLINRAVTVGLDHQTDMKDTGIAWFGKIPTQWKLIRIKYVASIKYGLGEPPRRMDEGLPMIRATNVERGKINPADMMYVDPEDIPWCRDPILRTDDIIVVRSGAYTGDSARIPREYDGAISGYDMVVRAHACEPRYLAWTFLSDSVKKSQIDLCRLRAAQPHLNAEELAECIIVLPSTSDEQIAIVDSLDSSTSKIDSAIDMNERQIDLLLQYRTSLICKAVTGGIDTRDMHI